MGRVGVGNLTRTQSRMLEIMAAAPNPHRRWTGHELAGLMYDHFRTPEGAHMTAASLVRRGLAAKETHAGAVAYTVTAAGRQYCTADAYLKRRQR